MFEVTYGRLDEVLRSLGFSVRVLEGEAKVYQHEPTGALIYLPDLPATMSAIPRHLLAVRTTLDLFGIADPMEFATSLHKTG